VRPKHSASPLGGHFHRMRVKLGSPQAITASAHKFARITYHRITTGQTYDESIFARNGTRYKKMPTSGQKHRPEGSAGNSRLFAPSQRSVMM
jgi:hypothetical protein